MGMRADDGARTTIDEMAETLLFARGFRVEIEEYGIRLFTERAGFQNLFGRDERIVQIGMHEHAAHHVGHQDAGAVLAI